LTPFSQASTLTQTSSYATGDSSIKGASPSLKVIEYYLKYTNGLGSLEQPGWAQYIEADIANHPGQGRN